MNPSQIVMFIYLLILSGWDLRIRKIPVSLLVCGAAGVFLFRMTLTILYWPSTEQLRLWIVALLGAVPGFLMTMLSFFTDKVGRGDGLVLMRVGASESCAYIALIICMACIMLSAVSVILMLSGKVKRNTRMPYIPFITLSYACLKLYEGSYISI